MKCLAAALLLLGLGVSARAADPFEVPGDPLLLCTDGHEWIWTTSWHGNSVSKVHSPDGTIAWTVYLGEPGDGPTAICYDGDYIWVGGCSSLTAYQIRADDGSLVWSDLVETHVKDMVSIPGEVWLVGTSDARDDKIVRIDRTTYAVTIWDLPGGPHGICYDGRYLWVALYFGNALRRIDPLTGPTDGDLFVNGLSEPLYCRYGDGFVWVPLRHSALAKVNASRGEIVWIKPVGPGSAWGCLPDGNVVWVSKTGSSEVVALDAETGEIVHVVRVRSDPAGFGRAGCYVWVAAPPGLWRIYAPKIPEWRVYPIGEIPAVSCGVLRYDRNGMPAFPYLVEWDWDLGYAWREHGEWHSEMIETDGETGLSPDLAFSPQNVPTVVWHRGMDGGQIMFAQREDEEWNIEQINTWGDVGMKAKIGYLPDGTACGCYLRVDGYDLRFFWGGPGHWEVEDVDTVGDVGDDNSMAIGPDGQVCISYYDTTNRALKFARRKSPGVWDIQTVDAQSDAGWWTKLALLPDAHAVIAYTRHDTMTLHVALETDVGWEIQQLPVAVGPQDGYGLAIDPLGRPCVAALNYQSPQEILFYRLREGEWVEALVASGGEYYEQGSYVGTFSLAFNQAGRATVLFGDLLFDDLSNGNTMLAVEGMLSPWPGTFNTGWNWFSIPCEPVEHAASMAIPHQEIDNQLYRWDPVTKCLELYAYAMYDFRDLELGRGYALRIEEDEQLPTASLYGWPTVGDFEIYLPEAGWTWIGCPYENSVAVEDLRVRSNQTGEERTWWDDTQSGDPWLNWNLIYWDSQRRTMKICAPRGGDDDHLRPWVGYWIWANVRDLTLVVPEE
jgi:hypothetical protein